MAKKQPLKNKALKTVTAGLVTSAILAVGLISATGAQANESAAPSTQQEQSCPTKNDIAWNLYNGYDITNDTGQTLYFSSDSQVCHQGWGTNPPNEIAPGQTAYFEVRYDLTWAKEGTTADDSTVVYKTESGQTVTFHADVEFKWTKTWLDIPVSTLITDASGVSDGISSTTAVVSQKSEGRGTQTHFLVNPLGN